MGLFGKRKGSDPRNDVAGGNVPTIAGPNQNPFNIHVRATKLPTPGAMAYGLESYWLAWRAMVGPAIGQAIQWRTLYNVTPVGPQFVQTNSVATLTGVGGLAAGQMALQPLSNPYNP